MSKAVLIAIRKEHNDKIFAGKKKFEGRNTCPGNVEIKNYIDPTSTYNKTDDDVKFYVYEPKTGGGCGKVVGEFVCDFALSFGFYGKARFDNISQALCVSEDFARSYFNKGKGYMIRVNEPKRYDKPKELSEFRYACRDDHACNLCKYLTVASWDKGNTSCGAFVRRAPQSWQFVEELKYD